MLSLIIVMRILQVLLPALPSGLGDFVALVPVMIIICALLLKPTINLIAVSIYVFAIVWINAGIFMSGIQMVFGIENSIGIYFLDYVFPLLILTLPSFFKSKKIKIMSVFIAILINYFSHVISGWIFWRSYAWSGWGPWTYSLAANSIRSGFIIICSFIIMPIMIKSNRFSLIRNGYLNNSYKIKENNKTYQKRVPKFNISDWANEKNVYKSIGIKIKYQANGTYTREWIKGRTIKKWNAKKLNSLKNEIEKLHKIKASEIKKHDWKAFDQYKEKINEELYKKYLKNIKEIKKQKTVLSHNDINRKNVIWDGNKIFLIDFEWSRINSIYFDYAQFEIAEKINIMPNYLNNNEYQIMFEAILIFNYLWTFSMPKSNKIKKLRKRYKKLIQKKIKIANF